MKKLVSLLTLFAVMLTMASCMFTLSNPPIDYGKKYFHIMYGEDQYYVFEKDQTGYCEYYDSYSSTTRSGRVEFVWREASDGAIYLFETNTTYYADDNYGRIPLLTGPIYFSEDFFAFHSGDGSVRYIKEGSELEKLIEN